jgi:hypothetical protein
VSAGEARSAAYTLRDARAAIARERETRHWNISQWKEASSEEHWPSYIASVRREADEAVDWITDALDTLRSAWNAHMDGCPVQGPTIEPPTEADLAAWRDAPSGTASA